MQHTIPYIDPYLFQLKAHQIYMPVYKSAYILIHDDGKSYQVRELSSLYHLVSIFEVRSYEQATIHD